MHYLHCVTTDSDYIRYKCHLYELTQDQIRLEGGACHCVNISLELV